MLMDYTTRRRLRWMTLGIVWGVMIAGVCRPAWGAGGIFKGGMFRVSLRGVLEYDDNVFGVSDDEDKQDEHHHSERRFSLHFSPFHLFFYFYIRLFHLRIAVVERGSIPA